MYYGQKIMAIRNLDNIPDGPPSPMISFRADKKTIEILKIVADLDENKSEFIRNAILERFESEILEGKK